MSAYQKFIDLIKEYLTSECTPDESNKFCNLYMDLYYELSDNLYAELIQYKFEAFDDLNLICDSYEINPEIRRLDKYCIDEQQLKNKVIFYLEKIIN